MGVLTLAPTSVREYRGDFQVVGAVDELTAIQDTTDSSFVQLIDTYPTNTLWGASYIVYFAGATMPSGARVTKVYHSVRLKKADVTTAARRARIRVMEITQWKFKISTANLGTDYQHATSYPIASTAATINGTPITKRPDGSAITAATVGRLGIEIFQFYHASVHIMKANIIVEYDEQPKVTSIDQDGDTQSIASPIITWDYSDDTKPQYAYEVQLLSGSTLTYDSGKVYTGVQFHQVQTHLPDGTYTIKVRAAQTWTGPGGEFWSNWRTGTMVIKSQVPAPPSVNATADAANGRIAVDILSNLNKLSYESAHMDFRTGPVVTPANLVNCTVDEETTDTHSGNYSLRATFTGASPSVPIDRIFQPAKPGTIYQASAYVKAKTGSGNLTATVTIRFLNSSRAVLSSTAGTGVAESSGVYVQPLASATAPALTAYVDMVIAWSGGSAGQVHLADDLEIRATNALFASPTLIGGTSRGGMFEPDVPNLFTYEDFSAELTPVAYVDGNPTSADVSVTADVAWHGEAAVLMQSNGVSNSATITNDIAYPVTPGDPYHLRAFFLSAANIRAFHIDCLMYDQDGVTIGADQFPHTTVNSVVGKWTEISGLITIPAGAGLMQVNFHNASTGDNELHYWDGLQLCQTATDPGVVVGTDNSAGPYTTIEYSEDAGVTWQELATINAAAESRTYYDSQTCQGINRRYRAYNWKIVEGQTLLSSRSAATGDVTVAVTQTWMAAEDDPAGTLYGFIYWSGGRTDVPDMGAELNDYVGREFPMATFGETTSRVLSTGVGLPTLADQAAFAVLATKKTRILYRDRKGRRVWGIMSNVSIVDHFVGEQMATFDLIYIGNQP